MWGWKMKTEINLFDTVDEVKDIVLQPFRNFSKRATEKMNIVSHYHSSDPDTSKKAAEKIVNSGEISKQAALVFYHFKKVAPCTNKKLALLSGLDYELVHKRTADLKDAGLIEDSGLRENNCAILKLCEGKA